MGLFGKNTGAGQDGARHWTNVIKNSGPGGLLLWRQPEEDFNTDSTLVVMPGESAVFVSPVSYTHLLIFPTASTSRPLSFIWSSMVFSGGSREKSWRLAVRLNGYSPSNGRAITRPTPQGPAQSRLAISQ